LFARRSLLHKLFPQARPLRRYLYRDELERGVPFDVDWVSAGALFVRRELFNAVGGFDETYYYWHEVLFCDDVRRLGYGVKLHTDAKIIHYEGFGSGKRSHERRRWHINNFHEGAYRIYVAHHGLGRRSARRLAAFVLLDGRRLLLLGLDRATELAEKLHDAFTIVFLKASDAHRPHG